MTGCCHPLYLWPLRSNVQTTKPDLQAKLRSFRGQHTKRINLCQTFVRRLHFLVPPTLCPTPSRSDKQIYLDFSTTFFWVSVCVCGARYSFLSLNILFMAHETFPKGTEFSSAWGWAINYSETVAGSWIWATLVDCAEFREAPKKHSFMPDNKIYILWNKKPTSGAWCTFRLQPLGPTVDSFWPKSRMHFGMHKPTCCQRRAERSGIETDSLSPELARIGALTWPKPSGDEIGSPKQNFADSGVYAHKQPTSSDPET